MESNVNVLSSLYKPVYKLEFSIRSTTQGFFQQIFN